jgi:hypothetical protein
MVIVHSYVSLPEASSMWLDKGIANGSTIR